MGKQVEDYIRLKGVSEKFNSVAKSITEEEIKDLILKTIQNKIDEAVGNLEFFEDINEVVESWVMSNSFTIERMVHESLIKKLQ